MNSSYSRFFALSALCIVALSTTTQSNAFFGCTWITKKRAITIALVAAVGRLVTKDLSDVSDTTFYNEVKKLRSTPLTKTWLKQIWSLVDNYAIGYPGKGKGLKVVGSDLSLGGKKAHLGSYLNANDVEINLYGYNPVAPSGVLGNFWAYLQAIVKAMKFVKETDELAFKFHLTDTEHFARKSPTTNTAPAA